MIVRATIVLSLLFASSCGATPAVLRSPHAPRPQPTVASPQAVPAPPAHLRVATFNIQVFGEAKAKKTEVMDTLVSIVQRYDLIAVQEIKDRAGTVAERFLARINRRGPHTYALALSPRTGREPDDKSAQEQYAYYFRTDRLRTVGEPVLYDDSAHDYFQREPYVSRFELAKGGGSLVLINIHTQPRVAVSEIAAVEHVFQWAKVHFAAERNFMALGDFNAGCGYATEEALDALPLHGHAYNWVVPHSADTNLADAACPYDRIVIASPRGNAFVAHWGVDQAFTDKVISDHWPVWVDLVF